MQYTFFLYAWCFWVSLSIFMDFLILVLNSIIFTKCLQNRIFCHRHDLITTSGLPTGINHSENSKKAIRWCSIKYDYALKFHLSVKVNVNYIWAIVLPEKLEFIVSSILTTKRLTKINMNLRSNVTFGNYYPVISIPLVKKFPL